MSQNLEQTYRRIEKNKKERREINKMIKDELVNNERYQQIKEEMTALRDEKKQIERETKELSGDAEKLDQLKIDIQTDQEMLSDIALNMYVNDQTVEIIDEDETTWYPQFKVTFKKAH